MTVRFRMTLTRLRAYEAQAIVSSTTGGGFDYSYADILGELPSSWLCGIAANGDVIEPPCSAGHQAALDWIPITSSPGRGVAAEQRVVPADAHVSQPLLQRPPSLGPHRERDRPGDEPESLPALRLAALQWIWQRLLPKPTGCSS